MYTILIVLHVVACLVLIAVILLQAGKGAGLSDIFSGGGTLNSIFGTKTNTFLTKITTVCAILFIVTCLGLTVLSSHRKVSLMEGVEAEMQPQEPAPAQTSVPVQSDQPSDEIPGSD